MKYLPEFFSRIAHGDLARLVPGPETVSGIDAEPVQQAFRARDDALALAARDYLLDPSDLHKLLGSTFPRQLENFNPYALRRSDVHRQGNHAQDVAHVSAATPPAERAFTTVTFGKAALHAEKPSKDVSSTINTRFVSSHILRAEIPITVTKFQTDMHFSKEPYVLKGSLIAALLPFVRGDILTQILQVIVRTRYGIRWSNDAQRQLRAFNKNLRETIRFAQLKEMVLNDYD